MQITLGQLRRLISEEAHRIKEGKDECEALVESYTDSYSVDDDYVSKDALIDFVQALDEEKIPKIALEAFMANLPDETVTALLKEVVEK